MHIVRFFDTMKRIGLVLFAGFCLFLAPGQLAAQSDDPSEIFLKAYMTSQQGEKLEHDNQFQGALAKFRFAGSLLEELRKTHPDWQPAIVDFRGRKIGENILRVQNKLGMQKDLAATSAPPPGSSSAPVLPDKSGPAEPSVEIVSPRRNETFAIVKPAEGEPSSYVMDAAIKEATKKLQDKVDQLQTELKKSQTQYDTVAKEKENLNGRLQETSSKLEKAQADLDKTRGAEKEVRGQLAQAEESLKKISATAGSAKAQEALKAEITQLKKALTSAEEGRAAAEKEKTAAGEKLTEAKTEVATVTKERNALLNDLKNAKQAQERVQVLVAENSGLKDKLATAEKAVREISADKPKKEQEMAEVRRQLDQLRTQLAASQQRNKEYEVTVADLRLQLEETGSALEKAKLTGGNAEETVRLTKENDMLRKIVVRERQEEARRGQAKKLMLAEFEKLQIKSDTLNQQIELLAQPVTKLTSEELALLRQPTVEISDSNPAAFSASFTAPMNSGSGSSAQTGPKPAVPDELVPIAREAKESFDHGKYRAAEKQYQEILTKSPNNLYSLSNLGVVYFRTGKLKAAELTLKKAVALAPKDEFSHTTLGIVYYRQSKYDEAVTELTKALGINPKSAAAHNYLGITASQKGWQEAAEKEMLDAIAANPNYADAHFNLAVVYATNEPPAREQAKLHYKKATALGAAPDPALEKLLR
jgi:Flp pilus assembly protein TadD/predicted  nucleic acid-binding Zn-ribbon protein